MVPWPPSLQEPLPALEKAHSWLQQPCAQSPLLFHVLIFVCVVVPGAGDKGAFGSAVCSRMLTVMGTWCGTSQGLQSRFALHFCEGTPINVMFLAPGVTPWKTTLPGVSNGANNPGIRVIDYDRDTLQVLVGDPCVHHTAALEQL